MIHLLVDTDPGIDDALALLLGFASPEVEIIGITTVGGNSGITNTSRNALDIVHLVGRDDLPIAVGAAAPLIRLDSKDAEIVHGANGLGNISLPHATRAPDDRSAVELMVDLIEGCDEPVTLLALGPLTNVAALLFAHPRTFHKLARLVLMGGGVREIGNATSAAEFNIWYDPEAASAVFNSGLPVTMVGLDATMQAIVRADEWAPLVAAASRGGAVAGFVGSIVSYYSAFYQRHYGTPDTAQHDPLAMAAVTHPELLQTQSLWVEVECAGVATRGMTVGHFRASEVGVNQPPNVEVALGVDRDGFAKLIVERLGSLDEQITQVRT